MTIDIDELERNATKAPFIPMAGETILALIRRVRKAEACRKECLKLLAVRGEIQDIDAELKRLDEKYGLEQTK